MKKPVEFASLLLHDTVVTVSSLREVEQALPGKVEGAATAQPGDLVLMRGIPFLVVADDEADVASNIIVCQRVGPSSFKDDVRGVCSRCKSPIQFRPHAPKKATKICMECADRAAMEQRNVVAAPPGKERMQ